MNGKIRRCLLIACLLFIRPSSGFFKDKCNIDLDPTKLFEGKIQAKDVIVGAGALLALFQDNPSFEGKVPSTYKLIVDIVRTKVVPATNLAYVGAGIYGAAVLLTSYCYTIHSRKLLAEAQSIDIELNIMIDAEVIPILQHVEDLLNADTKDFCDAEIKLKEMLKDRILKIQTIRNDIKEKRQEAIQGQLQIDFLVLGSAAASIAFSATVSVPGTAVGVGVGLIGVCVMWAFGIYDYIFTVLGPTSYQQVSELLYQADIKAIEAQKMLTMKQTKIETECLGWVSRIDREKA